MKLKRAVADLTELPGLRGAAPLVWLAQHQRRVPAWLQGDVRDVEHIGDDARAGLARVTWHRGALVLQHACTRHAPQLRPLPSLLQTII